MYINLNIFFFFFFWSFRMCIHLLTFKGPQTTTQFNTTGSSTPTLRDKNRSAISTQLHIFIFTYTYTKRQNPSNLYCQKISLKSQDTQHKSKSIEHEIEKN